MPDPGAAILATFPWSTQRRSELEGARVMVGRMMVALALLFAAVPPSIAQGRHSAGRFTATFFPAQGPARGSKAVAALPDNKLGAFKADASSPQNSPISLPISIAAPSDRLVTRVAGAG
jgi:hypothetical protein